MLKIENLSAYYDNIKVLKNISINVKKGEIVSLIGANGAGKSTILNAIAGLIEQKEGKILFNQNEITYKKTADIVKMGISLVPEGRLLFKPLTVKDNLLLGAFTHLKNGFKLKDEFEFIYNIFPVLKERRNQLAGTLSGGEQQMLAIGRALMSKPTLLLLDEPSTGLAPIIANLILETIHNLNKNSETSILLVEQNVKAALLISSRAYIIENGGIIIEEKSSQLLGNKEIIRAYLGKTKEV